MPLPQCCYVAATVLPAEILMKPTIDGAAAGPVAATTSGLVSGPPEDIQKALKTACEGGQGTQSGDLQGAAKTLACDREAIAGRDARLQKRGLHRSKGSP
ncbi:hypothetical protein BHE74_00034946 [Ensete ventricosum]|nr:hypothetical protein GW17_00030686 [Ensete ventricosum]RWW58218.1 hypothetical protein BHE74_00034946 [Ensete ventricosum]RZS11129.1 hypothetical protein BHM03_00042451 [Ensete ventricosum]